MQPPVTVWRLRPPAPPEVLAQLAPLPPLAAQVMANRDLCTRAEVEAFLEEDYRQLADPFLMKGMAEATERLQRALYQDEPVVVYGDFDADGVTGAALLVQALRHMGGHVRAYIPHRIEEGYGLNRDVVEQLAAEGTRLLITVDCGTSNVTEVARAGELGMDVIVTDHHLPPGRLPPALALLNPRQADCAYPFKRLAGVGIAFTLVRGLVQAGVPRDGLRGRDLLDLVALGTVADVSPLVGENRILVAQGLRAIHRTRRPGLRALLAVSEVRPAQVNTGTIGFVLGPRLNAAGRLSHADRAYRLLLAETQEEAAALALELDQLNRDRQALTAEVLERARQQVLSMPEERRLIFLADPDFPAGVVGLVAGKVTEEFCRPTLLVELGEEESRGSARSIPAFHVTDALAQCAELLSRYGGHRLAAGFTVPNDNIPALASRLAALAEAQLDEAALAPALTVDAEAELAELNWEVLEVLEQLAPFGIENPRPLFLCRHVQVKQSRQVGAEGRHLRLTLSDGQVAYSAIAFRQGERRSICPEGAYIDVVCALRRNSWQGRERLDLEVRDLQPAGG